MSWVSYGHRIRCPECRRVQSHTVWDEERFDGNGNPIASTLLRCDYCSAQRETSPMDLDLNFTIRAHNAKLSSIKRLVNIADDMGIEPSTDLVFNDDWGTFELTVPASLLEAFLDFRKQYLDFQADVASTPIPEGEPECETTPDSWESLNS